MADRTVPAPISWEPSEYWDGNDGLWNTFVVEAGTPPQQFRVLPASAGQGLWIPVPEGCTSASPDDPGYCGYLRGTLPFQGRNSSGFATNESTTWENIGIYTLDAQQAKLGYGGNGLFGLETVGLVNTSGNDTTQVPAQVLAGIADPVWWLGLMGLGPKPSNFSTFNDPIPSFLSTMANETDPQISSLSWAYTAGASYRNRSPASLTFGGYDANRITTSISLEMGPDNSRPLLIGMQKITAENTQDGTVNLLPTGTLHFVDSTLPHIWLPNDAIEAFVSAFGLSYDNTTDLYLINDTMRARNLELSPTITFTFGKSAREDGPETTNIVLPYAAFDLNASYPFYQTETPYFPIRRAANDSQYTIGRTLFQEAYVIADFERNNFTIGQAVFDNLGSKAIRAIEKPVAASSLSTANDEDQSSQLSGGAIGGIVAGAVVGALIIAAVCWALLRLRRKQKQYKAADTTTTKYDSAWAENDAKVDFPANQAEHQSQELYGQHDPTELHATTNKWGVYGVQEMPAPGVGAYDGAAELNTPSIGHESGRLAEVHGSEPARFEMGSDETHRTE
ncbi:hypothetical protein CBER1_04914 [Cercospora berteroae]|uniref:Peptidase A1 domain-containing protein n=1 Tax=Cercospora berteroae TaxID=357750 RepID=A0A2S6BS30_9PEZI|nr:hypothetical protein CBER1_04914 [Cercospora berteroae]